MLIKRVILIILDGVGVGALPDAQKYNDTGANSLGNMFKEFSPFSPLKELPNLTKLGLFNILSTHTTCCLISTEIVGSYGKMAEISPGKDTITGHWELTGIILEKPFPTYPHGFPEKIINEFEYRIGRKVLGNCPASGTEIIKALGEEHIKTGKPIVYTSADSVFQIACHEEVMPVEELYKICQIAREILTGEHCVARVIARPFTGTAGNFVRTSKRCDFGIPPPKLTLLDKITSSGGKVITIGKIDYLFEGRGITQVIHTENNCDGMNKTTIAIKQAINSQQTLIFTNLVDFDTQWGHRRDREGYFTGLKEFDKYIPEIVTLLSDEDILFITSDHGCDPTYTLHTDHTREYVPLLVYGKRVARGRNLGTRKTFADLGQTIADLFNLEPLEYGESFTKKLIA